MKYENFEQAKELVKEIEKQTELLNSINKDNCQVRFTNLTGYGLITMFIDDDNNFFKEETDRFHSQVYQKLRAHIGKLKMDLEKL